MDKKKFLFWILVLLFGLQLTACVSGDQSYRGKEDSYWRHEDPALKDEMFGW